MAQGFTIKSDQSKSLYKIQEDATTGWVDITGPLSKEDCKVQYDYQLSQGTPPDRLKILRVQ